MSLWKIFLVPSMILFLTINVLAEENIAFRLGTGFTTNKASALFVGEYEEVFSDGFQYLFQLGTWTDSEPRHKSSFLGSFLVGKRLGNYKGFNGSVLAGVLFMFQPDSLLSTPFEFTESITVGYQKFGVGYQHVSNAGLKEPNIGRDHLFFRFVVPLN